MMLLMQAKGQGLILLTMLLTLQLQGQGLFWVKIFLRSADLLAGRLVQPFDLQLPSDYSFYAVVAEDQLNKPFIQNFLNWAVSEAKGEEIADVSGPIT